jgi:hypothetical protein
MTREVDRCGEGEAYADVRAGGAMVKVEALRRCATARDDAGVIDAAKVGTRSVARSCARRSDTSERATSM